LSSIVFSWCSEYLTKEALEGFGDIRIEGQVITTLKYADGLVLGTNEEEVPQGVFGRLIDIGSCCGMEINVEETKVMRMSRQPSFAQIIIDQVQQDCVECCTNLVGMITNNVICKREFKYRMAVIKGAFNDRKTFFTGNLDLNLRKKLEKYYIWSIALYGAETWTLRNVDRQYLESFLSVVLEKNGEDQLDRSCEK
jgi:hypothetical protein